MVSTNCYSGYMWWVLVWARLKGFVMNDLEINTELAKIVGFEFMVAGGTVQAKPFTVTDVFSCAHMGFEFNPLTDDALLMRLIKKYISKYRYDVLITPEEETEMHYFISFHGPEIGNSIYGVAALTAIIEAHKDD